MNNINSFKEILISLDHHPRLGKPTNFHLCSINDMEQKLKRFYQAKVTKVDHLSHNLQNFSEIKSIFIKTADLLKPKIR